MASTFRNGYNVMITITIKNNTRTTSNHVFFFAIISTPPKSALLAYTLSRRDFIFHKPFTILFVVTMYVSGGLIPEYLLIMRTLRLGNNFMVYILPQ